MNLVAIVGISLLGLSPASALVDPFGEEIAIAGTVTLKSGNTLVVRNGGVDTRVIVDQDTRLITRTGDWISYTDIELGDRIQAFGALVATRTLHADTIRDMVLPRGGFERVITGVVAAKVGNELTIRSGVTDTLVFLDQDTLIVDRTGLRTSLSALDIGDRVQAFGELKQGDLDADTVVNLSLALQTIGAGVGVGAGAYPLPGLAGYGGIGGLGYGYPSSLCTSPYLPCPQTAGYPYPQMGGYPQYPQQQYPSPQGGYQLPDQGAGTTGTVGALRTFVGTLTARSGNTLSVRSGGTSFTVMVDSSSKGTDRDGKSMSFARMRMGDSVQVTGTEVAAQTIKADVIVDLSVSLATIEATAKKPAVTAQKQTAPSAQAAPLPSAPKPGTQCTWVCK